MSEGKHTRLGTGLPFIALALSSCVSVYQPLVSLQRPVAVRTEAGNFVGVRVLIRCAPGDYLEPVDAERLCRKVRAVFANQGAEAEVEIPRSDGSASQVERSTKPDLVIDLTSRLAHEDNSKLLWLVSFATFTLVPAISDYTFRQDVSIRDADGFLLASDTYQGRFVRYFGLAVWLGSTALNWVRSDAEKLSPGALHRDFSRDFYGQLSQLAFNARMRAKVLNTFPLEAAKGP